MNRTRFTFADTMRTIAPVALALALFMGSVHVVNYGLATPAIAAQDSVLMESVARGASGAGFVLMVSLQRAR